MSVIERAASPEPGPQAYVPTTGTLGVRKVTAPPGVALTDLSLNESSWGPSPRAIEAARARAAELHRYPDPASTALRRALAERYDLDVDGIVCGNGSEELLDVVARCFVRAGDGIVAPQHGFVQFRVIAGRLGADFATAPERDLAADPQALLAAIRPTTRLVFLANPNNPTGTWLARRDIAAFVEALPRHVVLVLDEAYAEYAALEEDFGSGLDLVEEYPNLVVLRTFSKAYGLAALRVGWGHAPVPIAAAMNRVRGVGNVNALAQAAAEAALADEDSMTEVVRKTRAERQRLADELTQLGLAPVPSATNFVLFRVPPGFRLSADALRERLEAWGVIVRSAADHGLPEHLRATAGLPEETDRLLSAISDAAA